MLSFTSTQFLSSWLSQASLQLGEEEMLWCDKNMVRASREQQETKLRLYRQSADAGLACGQYLLGKCYSLHGVLRDAKQGAAWFRKV